MGRNPTTVDAWSHSVQRVSGEDLNCPVDFPLYLVVWADVPRMFDTKVSCQSEESGVFTRATIVKRCEIGAADTAATAQ